MADYEKVPLTKAETLALMGVRVWHERRCVAVTEVSVELPEVEAAASSASASVAAARAALQETQNRTPEAHSAEADQGGAVSPVVEAEIIEFTWVKGEGGMVLHTLTSDVATLSLLKDVVRFGDWRCGHKPPGKFASDDFRWPQLVDTSGTPTRALRAFFAKHLAQGGWLSITGELTAQLTPWLSELDVTPVELPALDRQIGDPATKKEIWQRLNTLA